MVMEVYIEKKRESGPELRELSVGKDKPAKKTDKDIKGITGEFGVATRKIEDSSLSTEFKTASYADCCPKVGYNNSIL